MDYSAQCSRLECLFSVLGNKHLVHLPSYRDNEVVVTSLYMMQMESLVFQNGNNVIIGPIEYPIGHRSY
jgi:hypothetical protein